MSQELKPGDVVMLRSGGPAMTVFQVSYPTEINGAEPGTVWVHCVWFDETGSKFAEWRFVPEALEVVGTAGAGPESNQREQRS